MRESTVESEFNSACDRLGGFGVKFIPLAFAGFPDRIAFLPTARLHLVELKAPGKGPSKLQGIVHRRLRGLGFSVIVLNTIEGVLQWERYEREQIYANTK